VNHAAVVATTSGTRIAGWSSNPLIDTAEVPTLAERTTISLLFDLIAHKNVPNKRTSEHDHHLRVLLKPPVGGDSLSIEGVAMRDVLWCTGFCTLGG
jgi:hypothetical protein